MSSTFLSAEYWNNRYLQDEAGWDIGEISTPLKEYFNQLTDKHIRILIPGGGNSYEAIYLYEQGFQQITIIDLAESVTEKLRNTFPPETHPGLQIITGDFFEHQGEYDLVVEQTFFCALDPSLRNLYVEHVKKLLSANGKLAGLLFNREFDSNPPFGGNKEAYRQLFSTILRISTLEDCYNSIPKRKDSELFLIATRK